MIWKIYLSGEIHTPWRDEIIGKSKINKLPVSFLTPELNHEKSDAAGDFLAETSSNFWRDNQSAKVNSIRIKNNILSCDLAVIKFGDKYKQWNAAFEAGLCAAHGKPYITLHSSALIHPLKEVDGSAMAWAENEDQVIKLITFVIKDEVVI